ncbi:MAG TPA: nuclear transport factor 2 family protein, partial [Vicinamibacteria bacterium]
MRLPTGAPPVAVLLAAGIACAPAPAQLSPADLSAIGEVSDAFLKGVLARDFAAVAGLYLEDAVLNPPNQPPVKGRAAVRTFLESFPPVREFKATRDQVDGRGDLAFVYGTYSMTVAPEGAP